MSTRATVYVHGVQYGTVKLYHHCDGYISGLGDALIDAMNECRGMNVLTRLFQIGGFEVDDIRSNHSDVEYVYDITVENKLENFRGKDRPVTTWKIEVRGGYGEDKIKEQKSIELANGFDLSDTTYNYMWDYDKAERELKDTQVDDDVVESLDTDSIYYQAYYN